MSVLVLAPAVRLPADFKVTLVAEKASISLGDGGYLYVEETSDARRLLAAATEAVALLEARDASRAEAVSAK